MGVREEICIHPRLTHYSIGQAFFSPPFLPQIYLSLRYLKLEHEEGAPLVDVELEGGHS